LQDIVVLGGKCNSQMQNQHQWPSRRRLYRIVPQFRNLIVRQYLQTHCIFGHCKIKIFYTLFAQTKRETEIETHGERERDRERR
jgi:hypothetical protein